MRSQRYILLGHEGDRVGPVPLDWLAVDEQAIDLMVCRILGTDSPIMLWKSTYAVFKSGAIMRESDAQIATHKGLGRGGSLRCSWKFTKAVSQNARS